MAAGGYGILEKQEIVRLIKWALLAFGALIVFAIAMIALLDLRPDADRMRAAVIINAPPDAIWPWLYEPDKLKSWVNGMVEVRQKWPGAPQAGEQSIWVMEDRNRDVANAEVASRIDEAEPAHKLSVVLNSPGSFSGSVSYTLTNVGNGRTGVEEVNRYHFDNRLAQFLMPLVTQAAQRKMAADLEHLRTLVEAGAGAKK